MYQPTISVIIPCFNRARYVCEAIDSALDQTEPALEIIAVDDGSTDETPALLAAYGNQISVVTQTNSGVAAARNTGIEAAQGDYIALLDSDDVWLPEKLAVQRKLALRWPDAVLIHTLCATIDEYGRERKDTLIEYPDRREEDALERLMGHCYPTTSSYLIKANVLKAIGGFSAEFERGGGFAAEDWELCLRLAEQGPFASAGKSLVKYRVHGESKTLADRLPHTLGLIALRQQIESRKEGWLKQRDSLALRRALRVHMRCFAHVYGRLGLIYQQRGEVILARDAFQKAMRLEPYKLKHRLRYFRMSAAATLSSMPGAASS